MARAKNTEPNRPLEAEPAMRPVAKRLLTAFAICALAACATQPSSLLSSKDAAPSTWHGYIAGTFAVDCHYPPEHHHAQDCRPIAETIELYLQNLIDFRIRRVMVVGGKDNHTGKVPNVPDEYDAESRELRHHFCIALPPGRFRLGSIHYFYRTDRGNFFQAMSLDESFAVQSNSISLLGEIKFLSKQLDTNDGRIMFTPDGVDLRPHARANLAVLDKCPEEARTLGLVEVPLRLLDAEPEKHSHGLPDWMVPDRS